METIKARSVDKVLEKIIILVPEHEQELKEELNVYLTDLCNKAPEVRKSAESWVPLQKLLAFYIRDFEEEWKLKVLSEFNGSS